MMKRHCYCPHFADESRGLEKLSVHPGFVFLSLSQTHICVHRCAHMHTHTHTCTHIYTESLSAGTAF